MHKSLPFNHAIVNYLLREVNAFSLKVKGGQILLKGLREKSLLPTLTHMHTLAVNLPKNNFPAEVQKIDLNRKRK